MIIGKLVHIECIPGLLVPGLHNAGKNTVPEVDFI
jgi:hypothetical protein